jgi:hypothetical protein
MATQLTLDVPDAVVRRAALVAAATQRGIEDVMREALELAFPALDPSEFGQADSGRLSDAQVLALSQAHLPADVDARLSELLGRRQAGESDEAERAELAALIQNYQSLWLRQSAALAEAVRRGLRPPLEP